MESTAFALAGYISWCLLLILGIVLQRAVLTLTGKHAANEFKPDGSNISDFSVRLSRAHANCYESFPLIGGLLILALLTDMTQVTNSLALIVLLARIGQSSVHLVSTSVIAVQIRFAFFLVQLVICLYWAYQFLRAFAGF